MKSDPYKTLISSFSHEFGNLLSLATCALLLMETDHPEVKSYAHWDDVKSELKDMRTLLLSLSQYNHADQVNKKKCSIPDILAKLYRSCLPWFKESQANFSLNCQPSIPDLLLDEDKIYLALLNLVKNSFEALNDESSGEVSISACIKEEQLLIKIIDTGCGMNDEQLETVFTPYVTSKLNGTGLGLPIARQTILGHGGDLHIESIPHKGTRIQITLPLE